MQLDVRGFDESTYNSFIAALGARFWEERRFLSLEKPEAKAESGRNRCLGGRRRSALGNLPRVVHRAGGNGGLTRKNGAVAGTENGARPPSRTLTLIPDRSDRASAYSLLTRGGWQSILRWPFQGSLILYGVAPVRG